MTDLVIQRLTYVGKSGAGPLLAEIAPNLFGLVIGIPYESIGEINRPHRRR
jgi:hypothetical protein